MRPYRAAGTLVADRKCVPIGRKRDDKQPVRGERTLPSTKRPRC